MSGQYVRNLRDSEGELVATLLEHMRVPRTGRRETPRLIGKKHHRTIPGAVAAGLKNPLPGWGLRRRQPGPRADRPDPGVQGATGGRHLPRLRLCGVRCRGDDHRVTGAIDIRGHHAAYLCGDHLPRGLRLDFGWTHLVKNSSVRPKTYLATRSCNWRSRQTTSAS